MRNFNCMVQGFVACVCSWYKNMYGVSCLFVLCLLHCFVSWSCFSKCASRNQSTLVAFQCRACLCMRVDYTVFFVFHLHVWVWASCHMSCVVWQMTENDSCQCLVNISFCLFVHNFYTCCSSLQNLLFIVVCMFHMSECNL